MSNFVNREDIHQALETLKNGGLILYPTDTIWGIGCDATNPEAVEKVFALKGRDKSKSLIILLHNDNQLAGYVQEVPEIAYELIEATDRPLTIVYSKSKNLPDNVIAEDGSIGIRIVEHPFASNYCSGLENPLSPLPANLSGTPSATSFDAISEEVKGGVDYIVKFGQQDKSQGQPSIIMKVDPSGKFEFLRK